MEIKRINGVISTYSAQKSGKAARPAAAASAKNIDRVEFGFETALAAAKKGIASAVKADATAQEIDAARETAETGVSASELAGLILLG